MPEPVSQTKRRCVFCGDPADSKEDVWPQWLVHLFGNFKPRMDIEFQEGGINRSYEARYLKSRLVCDGCNRGWMRELENRARPHITSMAFGKTTKIDSVAAKELATWAAKTAAMLEATAKPNESDRFFNNAFCAELRESLAPPRDLSIRIGSCPKLPYLLYSHATDHTEKISQSFPIAVFGKFFAEAFIVFSQCIVVGHLVLAVFGLRVRNPDKTTSVKNPDGPPVRKHMVNGFDIWPWPADSEPIVWPPKFFFYTEEQVKGLIDRYQRRKSDPPEAQPPT